MRAKEERLIVTFPSTAAAIAMEKRARELGVPGRLIPTPTVITAACGLAWMAPAGEAENMRKMLSENNLQHETVWVLLL